MYIVTNQSGGQKVLQAQFESEAEALGHAVNLATDFLDKEYPRKRTHVSVSKEKDGWLILGNAYSSSTWWKWFVSK